MDEANTCQASARCRWCLGVIRIVVQRCDVTAIQCWRRISSAVAAGFVAKANDVSVVKWKWQYIDDNVAVRGAACCHPVRFLHLHGEHYDCDDGVIIHSIRQQLE